MTNINTQGFGIQLAPAGFPLEANKIFADYSEALTFVRTNPAAYVSSVISVKAASTIDGTLYPAGVYHVTAIGENGALEQVGKDPDLSGITGLIDSVKMEKLSSPSSGAAASYRLSVGGSQKGVTIDIPKDMVVSSGEVRKLEDSEIKENRAQGLYIVLTLANAAGSKLYIPADSLVDVYNGDAKYILVNQDTRTITINIDVLANSIANSEYIGAKLAALASDLQTELNNLARYASEQFDVVFPEVMLAGSTAWVQVNGCVSGFSLRYGQSNIPFTRLNTTGKWSFVVPAYKKGVVFSATVETPFGNHERIFNPIIIAAPYIIMNGDGFAVDVSASVSMNGTGTIMYEGSEFMGYEMERLENYLYLLFPERPRRVAVYNKGQYVPMELCSLDVIPENVRPENIGDSWVAFRSIALKEDPYFQPKIVAEFSDPTVE